MQPDTQAQIVANVIIGLIAVGGSILGAILGAREGARASLAATKAFAEENELRQRASVRLRLRLEIDHNLANLATLQAALRAAGSSDTGDEEANAEEPEISWHSYARELVHTAMPAWTREAWESLTLVIAPALDATEIEQANHFYGQLETISGIREQLTVMENEKPYLYDWGFGQGPRSIEPMTFHDYGPGLALRVDEIISTLRAAGNPIVDA